jgi:hypothetical protein
MKYFLATILTESGERNIVVSSYRDTTAAMDVQTKIIKHRPSLSDTFLNMDVASLSQSEYDQLEKAVTVINIDVIGTGLYLEHAIHSSAINSKAFDPQQLLVA